MKILLRLITIIAVLITGGCSKSDSGSGAPAKTVPVINAVVPINTITTVSASSGASISSDGGAGVTARGVCWNTAPNPTTANSKTSDGSGTGIFVSNLTGLTPATTYYVRAYATNSLGTAYGFELGFTTN